MTANIPTKVLSQQIREYLTARRVTAAVFLTYTLERGFFEEEIVSLLAGDALIQEPKIRLWQLEEALRGAIGPISVYYDQAGLRPEKGKNLDIRYVPVRVKTAVFEKGKLHHIEVDLHRSTSSRAAVLAARDAFQKKIGKARPFPDGASDADATSFKWDAAKMTLWMPGNTVKIRRLL